MALRLTEWQEHPACEAQAHNVSERADKPIKPSQYHRLRGAVLWVNSYLHNGLRCLPDDDEGRDFFVVLRALALPDNQIDTVAPWLREAPEELPKLDKRAKYFTANSTTIGQLLKVTKAMRKAYAAGAKPGKRRSLPFRAYDEDWDEHQRALEVRRNARRKQKREEARAALAAQCDPQDVAVIEAMGRIARRPECTPPKIYVRDIMDAMTPGERAAFPAKSFRRLVYRSMDRLEAAGTGWRKHRNGCRIYYSMWCRSTADMDRKSVTSKASAATSQPIDKQQNGCDKSWSGLRDCATELVLGTRGLVAPDDISDVTAVGVELHQPRGSHLGGTPLSQMKSLITSKWVLPDSPLRRQMLALQRQLQQHIGAPSERLADGLVDNVIQFRKSA